MPFGLRYSVGLVYHQTLQSTSLKSIDRFSLVPYDKLNKRKRNVISRGKLEGIITASIVVIIVAIILSIMEPWAGTRSIQTRMLTATISPSGAGYISPSGGEYESGRQITVTVCPANGYTFDHWNGDDSGNSTTITIAVNHDYSLIASFTSTVSNPSILIAPPCEAMEMPTNNLDFTWTEAAGEDKYYFVLSVNPHLSAPIVEAIDWTSPFYEYSEYPLDYSAAYYWQVPALGGSSIIASSTIGIFSTNDNCEAG